MDVNLQTYTTDSVAPVQPDTTRSSVAVAPQPSTQTTSTPVVDVPSNSLLARIVETNGQSLNDLVSDTALENAVNEVNETMQHIGRRIEHSVHEDTNTIMVRVVNSYTGEVIRELPDESRLDALASLREALGININTAV